MNRESIHTIASSLSNNKIQPFGLTTEESSITIDESKSSNNRHDLYLNTADFNRTTTHYCPVVVCNTNKSPDNNITNLNAGKFEHLAHHSGSKLSKLNRSISASILSINKFKRKKAERQSMNNNNNINNDQGLVTNGGEVANLNLLNGGCSGGASTYATSKNLLKQIENLHEQAGKLK